MKDNRGFAITTTIYGFLLLFLIILFCLLLTMRLQNNNSIILDEKVSDRVFSSDINIDYIDGVVKGRYDLRLFKDGSTIDGCYAYVPKNVHKVLNLSKEFVYKIGGTDVKVKIYGGSDCTNSQLNDVLILNNDSYVTKEREDE